MNYKENPDISVIMSVYEPNELFLREAIESILFQKFLNFEFIIIIDDSNPKTKKIIENYTDERIIILINDENLGLTKSLNRGISIAKGKYIARMDADDISYPKRFLKQYKYMEENKSVSVVGALAENIGTKGRTNLLWTEDNELLRIRMLFYNAGIIHPTAFIRKDFLHNNMIQYNENLKKCQDYGLWVDVLKNSGEIKVIPEVLLGYRRHANQITSKNSNEIEYFTNIVRMSQWNRFGVEFDKYESNLLKSLSSKNVSYSTYSYKLLFNKVKKINMNLNLFNKKKFNAELYRLWLNTALKKVKYTKNPRMLFTVNTFKNLHPYNVKYLIQFYILKGN